MRKLQKWNYQPVLNVLMTFCIVLLAFPVFARGSTEVVPMAINLNGSTDYINYGDVVATRNLTKISICSWIYPESFGAGSLGRIVEKFSYSPIGGFSYGINDDAYVDSIIFNRGWSTVPGSWHVANAVVLNAINFQCVTYDGSSVSNDPIFYAAGAALAAPTEDSTPSGSLANDTGYNLFVGASSAAAGRYFDGPIMVVQIYNFIITPADVADMYASRSLNVHPAQGLPVFQPILYGASGLQAFDGATLSAGNKIVDPYSGAYGTPEGNPTGLAETFLTLCP